ncbi:MAG: preprotein translocase subunit SecG [Cellvibrionaceae bacterium]
MENIVIIVHVLVALAIIGLILIQQGKGAEAGASFGGGASQTVFGSQGGGNFFSKLTGILAFVFFVTSFSLAVIAKNKASIASQPEGVPSIEQVIPQESEVPVVGTEPSAANTANDIPVVVPEPAADSASEVPAVNQQ